MKNKYYTIITFLFFLALTHSIYADSNTAPFVPTTYNLVMVVDCSGSINTTSRDNVIPEFVSLFADTLPNSQVNLGLIMYNGDIIKSISPISLSDPKNREIIKQAVFTTPNSGYTDIGLALKNATSILGERSNGNEKSIIFLISDGETELPKSSPRTISESNKDKELALTIAKEKNIPIYTFQVGNYAGKQEKLSEMSFETGGNYFKLDTHEDALSSFLFFHQKQDIQSVSEIDLTNNTTLVSEILSPYATENTLCLIMPSGSPDLKSTDSHVPLPKYKTDFHIAYALGLAKEDDTFSLTSPIEATSTKAYLLSHYEPHFILDSKGSVQKNQPVTALISAVSPKTNKKIADKSFYNSIDSPLTVTGNHDITFNKEITSEGILVSFVPKQGGDYVLAGQLIHPNFNSTLLPTNIKVENNAPVGYFPESVRLCINKESHSFSLDNYFKDSDMESLYYSFEYNSTSSLPASCLQLHNSTLTIESTHKGNLAFKLKATDPEGAIYVTEEITLTLLPFFQYYQWISLLILFIIMLGMVITYVLKFYSKKKQSFSGRLRGYYVTPTYENIFPFDFTLHAYSSQLKLYDLLKTVAGAPAFKQTQSLNLLPATNHNLTIYYTESFTLLINNTLALKNKKYILNYGDTINIGFDDSPIQLNFTYEPPASKVLPSQWTS